MTAAGVRVIHADIWKKIVVWLDKFEGVEDRSMVFVHVREHRGVAGNERADDLAGMGSKLRHDLMVKSQPKGWFRKMLECYWSNRI